MQLDEIAFHLDASDILPREDELTPRQTLEAANLLDVVFRQRQRLVLDRLFRVGRRRDLFLLLDEAREVNRAVILVQLDATRDALIGVLPIGLIVGGMGIAVAHAIGQRLRERGEHLLLGLGFQLVLRLVGFQHGFVMLASGLVIDAEVERVACRLAVFFGDVEKGDERASLFSGFLEDFNRVFSRHMCVFGF